MQDGSEHVVRDAESSKMTDSTYPQRVYLLGKESACSYTASWDSIQEIYRKGALLFSAEVVTLTREHLGKLSL